jgi:hypothetical protein
LRLNWPLCHQIRSRRSRSSRERQRFVQNFFTVLLEQRSDFRVCTRLGGLSLCARLANLPEPSTEGRQDVAHRVGIRLRRAKVVNVDRISVRRMRGRLLQVRDTPQQSKANPLLTFGCLREHLRKMCANRRLDAERECWSRAIRGNQFGIDVCHFE